MIALAFRSGSRIAGGSYPDLLTIRERPILREWSGGDPTSAS